MNRACATCMYDRGDECKILHSKIPSNCFAWADESEAKQREKAILLYAGYANNGNVESKKSLPKEQIEKRTKTRIENAEKRGGKTVREALDEHFNWYYLQGMTDEEISKKVYVDSSRVKDYRRNKGLPAWNKKNRPALTGTA